MIKGQFRYVALCIAGISVLVSCKKDAGSGGTSSITGQVSGRMYSGSNGSSAEAEITSITIPDGASIDDGDYILLNTPAGGTNYYVWFHWNNGVAPDPGLQGRTGITVTYDFTETNLEVAANVAAAIQSGGAADFTVSLDNDIITVTNLTMGEVTDADELSSALLVDVSNQGKGGVAGSSGYVDGPIADERVYLIYGDDDFYSESVRTDAEGRYQFTGLNRGDYKVYVFSEDTASAPGLLKEVSTNVSIADKKEVVQATSLFVIHL